MFSRTKGEVPGFGVQIAVLVCRQSERGEREHVSVTGKPRRPSSSCSSIGHTAIAVGERGDDTASAACTSILYRVCYDPPDEHTSEGGRDDRGVPYHAESALSSAQVLKEPGQARESYRGRRL